MDTNEACTVLRDVIDQMCSAKNVFQGDGPPTAYFQTPPDAGAVKRFFYLAFGNNGLRSEGESVRGRADFASALKDSTTAFDAWLQPKRTLVWRNRPIVDLSLDGLWAVYWRCVQLDDGARSVAIDWGL